MAKAFWYKLSGGVGGLAAQQIFDAFRIAHDAPAGSRFFQRLFGQADAAAPVGDTITIDVQLRPSVPALDPEAQPGVETDEPQSDVEGANRAVIGVLVDLPWQMAVGLAPIAPDWESLAQQEPTGWLENLLVQSALSSPLLIEFSATEFGGAADSPPFWADAARSGLDLSGDFSAGFTLSATSFEVDRVTLGAGSDYNLTTTDNLVAAGDRLVLEAGELGDGERILFDGSAETDGSFSFFGGDSNDVFFGGGGRDWIMGSGGADTLSGGGGGDLFVYTAAGQSSGASYDTLADFNPTADRIDLPGTVSGFAAAITSGMLSTASFAADLGAALGGLGAGRAVWFAPNAGDLAGTVFLAVDANGTAGYQAGEDYLFAVAGSSLADLTSHTDIFV